MDGAQTTAERELRERCLELAVRADPANAVAVAATYIAFVNGAVASDVSPPQAS